MPEDGCTTKRAEQKMKKEEQDRVAKIMINIWIIYLQILKAIDNKVLTTKLFQEKEWLVLVVQKKHPLLNQLIKVGIGEEDQKSKL